MVAELGDLLGGMFEGALELVGWWWGDRRDKPERPVPGSDPRLPLPELDSYFTPLQRDQL